MKKRYVGIFLITALMIYLIIYRINANKAIEGKGKGGKQGGKGAAGAGGGAPLQVNGIIVTSQDFEDKVSISGSVEPNEQVQIRSQVAGIIEKFNFKEGSFVTKGQVLFKIEDSEIRAKLAEATSRQQRSKDAEGRAKQLLEKEAISKEEYEVISAEYQSFKAQTDLIQAQLAKTSVRAPFSGKIGLRAVSEGSYVTPDQIIASLVDFDPVKISFSVPEKYAHQINQNSLLTFTVAGSNEPISGKIFAIEPSVNPQTRTLEVKAIANNKEGKVLAGAFATIFLSLNTKKDAILIPSEAIIPIQNGKKVFVQKNGKAKSIIIKASTRTEDKVLVDQGLQKGDTLITSGIMGLQEETFVKVRIKGKNI